MRSYYLQINDYLQRFIKNIVIYDKKGISLKGISLSIMELSIIKTLGNAKKKKMYELIDELDVDRNSLVTMINKLQQQHLIAKTKSLQDKRVYILRLTDRGEEVYQEILQKEKDILFSLLNDFSFNEEKAIMKLLVKIDMLNRGRRQEKEIEE